MFKSSNSMGKIKCQNNQIEWKIVRYKLTRNNGILKNSFNQLEWQIFKSQQVPVAQYPRHGVTYLLKP